MGGGEDMATDIIGASTWGTIYTNQGWTQVQYPTSSSVEEKPKESELCICTKHLWQ